MLRRSLCQDMVIIKKIYPLIHYQEVKYLIPRVLNFAQSIDNERLNTIINKSCFIPNEDSIICDDNEGSLRVGSSDNTNSKSASKELKLKTLNKQINFFYGNNRRLINQYTNLPKLRRKFFKDKTSLFKSQPIIEWSHDFTISTK